MGTAAQRRGEILYAFIDSDHLRDALIVYTDFLRPLEAVVAWGLLQALHERDPCPWPERIPRDPDDPKWSYCFGGVALFVNFKTPAHANRRSRRTALSFTLLFQSRAASTSSRAIHRKAAGPAT